jgi:hypothetical protein
MTFRQGQRVRIRDKQFVGTVEKQLTSLQNVYVVMIENASPKQDKLVRGEDLELIAEMQWTA